MRDAIVERICPQCGGKTTEATCPTHGIPTLTRTPGSGDTVQTGEIIGGRYRVERLLGKGGFGAVYRATHVTTGQELVLKVLKPHLTDDETQIKRFLQEARTASRLSHPHTVRVYDFGQTDAGHLYLAMELLQGMELGQVLIQEGTLPPARAIHIALGVLKSLAEAHGAGLVHRDLKPDNIFLCNVHGEEDFVKVIDFGIAKPIEQGDDGGLTRTGFTVGTPKYMSPEQVLNKGVEGRSDLYALGVILYQCLSGELPLNGPSPVEIMMAQVQQEPPALSLVCQQELPAGLEAVVMRALRKAPGQRFVDAEDMRAALEEVLETAGLSLGRRARSAKMRAVTPSELEQTEEHRKASGKVAAPALDVTREASPVRLEQLAPPSTAEIAARARPAEAPQLDETRAVARPGLAPSALVADAGSGRTLVEPRPPVRAEESGRQPAAPTLALPHPEGLPGGRANWASPWRVATMCAIAAAIGAVWWGLAKPPELRPRAAEFLPSPQPAVSPPAPPAPTAAATPPAAVVPAAPKLLEVEAVDAAVAALAPAVTACAPAAPVLAGVLIAADGRATEIQFLRRSATGAVADCVTAAIRAHAFPADRAAARSAVLEFAAAASPDLAAPGAAAEVRKPAAKPRRAKAAGGRADEKLDGDAAL